MQIVDNPPRIYSKSINIFTEYEKVLHNLPNKNFPKKNYLLA